MGSMFDKISGKKTEEQIEKTENDVNRDLVRENKMIDAGSQTAAVDYYAQEARSDLLKWQQDLTDEIERLKHRLRSEVKDENGQWVPKMIPVSYNPETGETTLQAMQPLANEYFISYVEPVIEPFLSRNMFSSNFNEKRILLMLKNTCNDIANNMADNHKEYQMDFINFDIIMRLIKNVIVPGPFRALNDGQRKHDRTVAKRIEAFNDRELTNGKKSIMGVNA